NRGRVVGTAERGAVTQHAEARHSSRGVRAMAEAVERIRIGRGYRARDVGVVSVTHEVVAAFDLRGGRAYEARVGWRDARRLGGVPRRHRAGAAEVGVRVIDSGVDHGDVDTGAGEAERTPRLRRAAERTSVDVAHIQ